MIDIDISEIYKKTALTPTLPVRYKVQADEPKPVNLVFDIPEIEITEETVYNYLNMPIMFPITFKGGVFDIFNNGDVEQIRLDDFRLPDTAIAQFKASKEAVITTVNGGNTRIIETWSDLLWDVTIKGFTNANTDFSAEDIVNNLILFSRVKEVEVSGDIFQWLGITNLFIKNIDIQQNQGYGDLLSFTLNCYETEPVELILK